MEEKEMTVEEMAFADKTVASWRTGAVADNPAGPLYSGGRYAQADLTQRTGSGTIRCGTACTWSQTRYCC